MPMVRLAFFIPHELLERYDVLVYRSGVRRSHLLRAAVELGLPEVRAALPRLRARYGDGRRVRGHDSLGGVSAAERADIAGVAIERRLVRVGRVLRRRVPGIGSEELRAALRDACEPSEFGRDADELLDRVVTRVLGDPARGVLPDVDPHAPLA